MHKPGINPMSYDEYKNILHNITATNKYCDYFEAKDRESYIVMRHDVEFSPERAYKMHEVENSIGFKSGYFFQITNNAYNTYSKKNRDLIKEIHTNGHKIGLHYHLNSRTDIFEIKKDIQTQAEIMSEILGIAIDRYSFHRPPKELVRANIEIPGLINTYDPMFITYTENTEELTKDDVKYIADSMHQWTYGYPDIETLTAYPRIQILIHPFSWTAVGYDLKDTFKSLIEEKNAELIDTIDSEHRRFKEVRDAL